MRKRGKWVGALLLLVLLSGPIASAQVERVLADAAGITWPTCAAIMEIALRRLEGVAKVTISISNQTFEVIYRPGARFRPAELREAVGEAEVIVVRFYVSARGQVRQEVGKRYLLAGKDKFLLVNADKLPLDTPISVVGSVNDSSEPYELKVAEFKPLPQQPSR